MRRQGGRGAISLMLALAFSSPAACGPGVAPSAGLGTPELLVADGSGVRLLAKDEETRFTDASASLAVPDLTGGVVFQNLVHRPTAFERDEAAGRNIYVWEEGGPDPILRVRGPDEPPEMVVEHPDGLLTLVDVVLVDGRPQVLHRLMVGGPTTGESAWDQVLEWLVLQDLESGEQRILGLVGAFESSHNTIRIGGGLVVVTHVPYGDPGATLIGSFPFADLNGLEDDAWLPGLAEPFMLGPGTACGPTDACTGWALATAPRDGSRLSWVQGGVTYDSSGEASTWPVEILIAQPEAAVHDVRIDVGVPTAAGNDPADRPATIDDDGTTIVISGVGPARRVLLVTATGDVVDPGLDGSVARFWTETG
jgi:hypothetical protein